jgi:hypothetical protein
MMERCQFKARDRVLYLCAGQPATEDLARDDSETSSCRENEMANNSTLSSLTDFAQDLCG